MTRETFLDNSKEILVGFYDTLAWAVGSELIPHSDCRALFSTNTYNWLIEVLSPESPKPKTLFTVPVLIDDDIEDGVIELYADVSKAVVPQAENHQVSEVCPNCGSETTMTWDVTERGYKAWCPVCGARLMLCDACQHDKNDNYTDDCDYCGDTDSCKYNPEEDAYDEEG